MYKSKSRRTNREIEEDIYRAVSAIVLESGVESITLKLVAKKANMDIGVLTRRYRDDDALIQEYTERFDGFVNYVLGLVDQETYSSSFEFFSALSEVFIEQLYKDKEMQAIMRWEMSYDTNLTRRSARKRDEVLNEVLPNIIAKVSPEREIDPGALLAVLVAGMYYLILRENRSEFCGVEFGTRAGRALLSSTLAKMVEPFLK